MGYNYKYYYYHSSIPYYPKVGKKPFPHSPKGHAEGLEGRRHRPMGLSF